jgi:3',5'-cyclic AMP phosphodiesterase CpdA
MINIVHLSDIHFGNPFDCTTWDAVAAVVIEFDPDLIIVSGDVVHDPSPAHLLAAKYALRDLSRRANERSRARGNARAAELVVIPGNHDVFESGVAVGQSRLDWFERIFHFEDTSRAEAALVEALDWGDDRARQLGFNPTCQGFAGLAAGQSAGSWQKLKARVGAVLSARFVAPWQKGRDFTVHLSAPRPQPRVRRPAGSAVVLALLDSNPTENGLYTATGLVGNDQLISLRANLALADRRYLARIAVIHHHVLPIAFAPGQQDVTGEPMMVLRNAGAVLRVLADYHFDLILHGHWHKAQFARIDLGTDDHDSYPISVVASGSAAMKSENPDSNCFNLITVADNGRIAVKSVLYGSGQAPNPHGEPGRHYRRYEEPMAAVKRRAYARARERHPIECDLREQICEITENGDLWVTHRVTGLRLRGDLTPYPRRPLAVFIPPHGHFVRKTLRPDAESARAGVRLTPAPDHPGSGGRLDYYWIELPGGGLVLGGSPANYSVSHGCANCMTMTRWEAKEKAKPAPGAVPNEGWDDEWVGVRIVHPTRRLVLSAKFPQSLVAAQPEVVCFRHSQYPGYVIDRWGDADMPPENLPIDLELLEEEQRGLRFDASTRTWSLKVDRPMVGYLYSLRWKMPTDKLDARIAGETLQWQGVLLRLGGRVFDGTTGDGDGGAIKQFDLLRDLLQKEICPGRRDESWVIALFVYDSDGLALRPALSVRSWTPARLPPDFKVPLGDGVTGAAFLQRRIVTWSRQSAESAQLNAATGSSLIEPVPHPPPPEGPIEMVNVLALPVYHPAMEEEPRPPPWAAIGVVTIGSSSYGSPIAGLESDPDDTQRRAVSEAAQMQMSYILDALR